MAATVILKVGARIVVGALTWVAFSLFAQASPPTLDNLYEQLHEQQELLKKARAERGRDEQLNQLQSEIETLEANIERASDRDGAIAFVVDGKLEWIDKKAFREMLAVVAAQSSSPDIARFVVAVARMAAKLNQEQIAQWRSRLRALQKQGEELGRPAQAKIEQISNRIQAIRKAIGEIEDLTANITLTASAVNPDNKFGSKQRDSPDATQTQDDGAGRSSWDGVVNYGIVGSGGWTETVYNLTRTTAEATQRQRSTSDTSYQINFKFRFPEPSLGKFQSKTYRVKEGDAIVERKMKAVELELTGTATLEVETTRFLWAAYLVLYPSSHFSVYQQVPDQQGVYEKVRRRSDVSVGIGWAGSETVKVEGGNRTFKKSLFLEHVKKTFVLVPTNLDGAALTVQLNSPGGGRVVTWTFTKKQR